MTAISIGDAASRAFGGLRLRQRAPARSGAPHPTGAAVLRNSIEAGTFEELFFAVPAQGEINRLLNAARRTLDAGRRLRRDARIENRELTRTERLIACLTSGGVRVYEELLTLARLNGGRVYPSYDYLAEATGLGRATVARAIATLESIGFVVRQRRFARVAVEGPGPRYKQTSNAYRPMLPKCVLAFLPRWMRPAPVPDDQLQRDTERLAETATMLAGLSCKEFAQATVGGALGKVLAKFGASIDHAERESQIDTQPLVDFINLGSTGVGLVGQRTVKHSPSSTTVI